MIRTASIKDSSNMIKYIPSEALDPHFEESVKAIGVENPGLIEAAWNFDESIKILHTKESEAKDYLWDLVKVFDGVFKGEENKHLKLFF